jgi:hypothetical protein
MTHRKVSPKPPTRPGFIRYHAGSERYEIHYPLATHSHLFDREPWLPLDTFDSIPPEILAAARALGTVHDFPPVEALA